MKSLVLILSILILGTAHTFDTKQSTDLAPYYRVAVFKSSIANVTQKVNTALKTKGFSVIGSYSPGNNANLKVIAFTRSDLKKTVIKVKDRGALASALKVGIYKKGDLVYVTVNNPLYLFHAYLRNDFSKHATALKKVNDDAISALGSLGNKTVPFGGNKTAKELTNYHYMMGMPYFTDPVELKKFASYEVAVATIKKNLQAKKGNTVKVYEVSYPSNKVTVFGVGLLNKTEGEAHFLPIIGKTHVAAMPYEIIVQGNTATMLHGRYRIALHWPDLTMGTFTKIMSTPGDVEEAFKQLMN